MAVGRLSGVWVLEALRTEFPTGTERRDLLNYFAGHLVSARARAGAKGRLARKLYRLLEALLRKGRIQLEGARVELLDVQGPAPRAAVEQPLLSADLRRKLFAALMAMDGDEAPGKAARVRAAQAAFLGAALEAGWTHVQAGRELGLAALNVHEVLGTKPPAGNKRSSN